jgi:hypothetical protein
MAVGTTIFLAGIALAACGESAPSANNPTPSPVTTAAACTVAAVIVPIKAAFNTADNQATTAAQNGDLLCASGIARITIMIGPVNAPTNGPQGSPHLVLLEDHSSQWVIANDQLFTSAGQPAKPIPAELGTVCGVQ